MTEKEGGNSKETETIDIPDEVIEEMSERLVKSSSGDEGESKTTYDISLTDYEVHCAGETREEPSEDLDFDDVDEAIDGDTNFDEYDSIKELIEEEDLHIHTSPDYARFIKEDETVAGDFHHIGMTIQNDSDVTFPGGEFSDIEVAPGFGSSFAYNGINKQVPELEPGESHEITFHLTIQQSEDLTIKGALKPNDGGNIKCEMMTNGKIGFGTRSVPRESLMMLDLLEDIKGELE